MSNTPETNALLKQCKIKGRNPDPWKLCRKLERERDEARAVLKVVEQSHYSALYREGELKRERDEARELFRTAMELAQQYKDERDEARNLADAAMWEADRLRSKLWRAR